MTKDLDIESESIELIISTLKTHQGLVAYAAPGESRLTLSDNCHVSTFDHSDSRQPFYERSTTKNAYIDGLENELTSLKANGGKTVYSRVIAGHSEMPLSEAITHYFSKFPDTFRFIFAQNDGTLWFGASPELLIDNRPGESCLLTCALAGTRPYSIDESDEWDNKNIEEHSLVVDFIYQCLHSNGLRPAVGALGTLRFGPVVHLHTPIAAESTDDCLSLLDKLSPTPALAGYPRDHAMKRIAAIEKHKRGYYGGYIAVGLAGQRTLSYVILRCARVRQTPEGFDYNIFVGGGLTPSSLPESEWRETTLKGKTLLECLTETSCQKI